MHVVLPRYIGCYLLWTNNAQKRDDERNGSERKGDPL